MFLGIRAFNYTGYDSEKIRGSDVNTQQLMFLNLGGTVYFVGLNLYINNSYAQEILIEYSIFYYNIAGNGGAISFQKSLDRMQAVIKNNYFQNNIARGIIFSFLFFINTL